MNTNEEKENKISINTKMPPLIVSRITEMSKHFGLNRTSLIIQAVNEKWEAFTKTKFGYKGAVLAGAKIKKEVRKEELTGIEEDFRAMDKFKLTDKLREIGYFKPDAPLPEVEGVILRERIVDDDITGEKVYEQQHYNLADDIITYRRTIFTFNELMNDLKKQKFI